MKEYKPGGVIEPVWTPHGDNAEERIGVIDKDELFNELRKVLKSIYPGGLSRAKGKWDNNFVCSICGSQLVDIAFKDKTVGECVNYCPCCGADMRGKE